jgi:HAD superfamily hydrolase (TIGR01549 family)
MRSDEAAHWYERVFMSAFVAMLSKYGKIRPGLVPLLESLHEKGIKLAVVSDFGQVRERLTALGIPLAPFDDLVSVEECGALKPSPKSLQMVATKWKINAAELTVVGDREDLDAVGARAAGMAFVGVTNRDILIRNKNGFICWSEVTKMLRAKTKPATCT